MSKDKVISLAIDEVGYTEGKRNDNKFAAIAGHPNHLPWCMTYLVATFKAAGLDKAIPNSSSVEFVESWARKHKRIRRTMKARKGDLIVMDFDKSGKGQHIGLAIHKMNIERKVIHTIEGNTGNGSEINGDGVAIKTRSTTIIRCVIRPKYPKHPGAETEVIT
tara:strand:- start:61 stop:549 length:489 start_codon:yes stop_codon:yes gene_type:complete